MTHKSENEVQKDGEGTNDGEDRTFDWDGFIVQDEVLTFRGCGKQQEWSQYVIPRQIDVVLPGGIG